MEYYFSKTIAGSFDNAIQKVRGGLSIEGFGTVREIDIKATLNRKLARDFHNYTILEACIPPFAYKTILAEDKMGAMLPCNVIVQEKEADQVKVIAVDPVASMKIAENPNLMDIATRVRASLQKVLELL